MTEIAAPLPARRLRLRSRPVAELAALLFFAVVMGLPILFLLIGSFNTAPPGQASVYGLDNWVRAFSDPQTLSALWMSFLFSVVRLVPSLMFSVTAPTFSWIFAVAGVLTSSCSPVCT